MRNFSALVAVSSLCLAPLAQASSCVALAAEIDEAFREPSKQYRPKFRYWQVPIQLPDASVPADVVRRDIASVADIGGGGVEFVPYYLFGLTGGQVPPTDWAEFGFGSPAYKELLKAALEETKASGLVIDIAQGANQGQGVPSVPRTPGLAVELMYGVTDVASGSTFDGPLPQPSKGAFVSFPPMHEHERFGEPILKAVLAGYVNETTVTTVAGRPTNQIVLDEESIIDLTAEVASRALKWKAPRENGTWKIIAFYESYTNQRSCAGGVGATDVIANGSWIVDHFSSHGAKRITDFWDANVIDTQEMKDLIASAGHYFWEDGMEMQAALFWTPELSERFENNRGYSVTRFLPLFFDISNQFESELPAYNETWVYGRNGSSVRDAVLADYRTTLTEGYQEYLSHFVNWSHALGVQYSAEPAYNLPLDMPAAVPIVDAPELETLEFPTVDAMRQFTGPALLAGRSVISTEVGAVPGASYMQTVPELLDLFKESFAAGVSMMVIHGFAYTGEYTLTNWPGYDAFLYSFTEMWNNKVPSWNQMKDAMDFAARNSLILQSGKPQTDLAFYSYAAPFHHHTKFQSTTLSDLGFSYDYLGPENLSPDLEVKDGILAPSGPAYQALIISNETAISGATVDAIKSYASAGLPIFLVGKVPQDCLGVNACPDGPPAPLLRSMTSQYTNAQALPTANELPAALRNAGIVPRVAWEILEAGSSWYSVWRRAGDGLEDYVYIYNDGKTATLQTTFSVNASSTPYILDAWTGERSPVLQYEQSDLGIIVPVTLQANQSRIYAFSGKARPGLPATHATSSTGELSGIYPSENGTLEVRAIGATTISLSDGRVFTETSSQISPVNIASWDLSIISYVPSSANSTATAFVTIERPAQSLVPWSQIAGLESVSGIGEYNSTFDFPYNPAEVGASISFGPVRDTLRAWVNDRMVPPIDVTDPRADITQFLKQGTNSVRVVVTSTLFNAVKARANSTMMVGITAASANPLFLAAPLAEFGLLGPIMVQPLRRIFLD